MINARIDPSFISFLPDILQDRISPSSAYLHGLRDVQVIDLFKQKLYIYFKIPRQFLPAMQSL